MGLIEQEGSLQNFGGSKWYKSMVILEGFARKKTMHGAWLGFTSFKRAWRRPLCRVKVGGPRIPRPQILRLQLKKNGIERLRIVYKALRSPKFNNRGSPLFHIFCWIPFFYCTCSNNNKISGCRSVLFIAFIPFPYCLCMILRCFFDWRIWQTSLLSGKSTTPLHPVCAILNKSKQLYIIYNCWLKYTSPPNRTGPAANSLGAFFLSAWSLRPRWMTCTLWSSFMDLPLLSKT